MPDSYHSRIFSDKYIIPMGYKKDEPNFNKKRLKLNKEIKKNKTQDF